MSTKISKFVEERNAALFSLDRSKIEAFCARHGVEIPENDIAFWGGIYKCICNITASPPELVAQAQAWLHAHGMSEEITLA